MDYDDFYYEPSESDIFIGELKEHLRNEVKKEILNELEELRKENNDLQEIKQNKQKLENEYNDKILQLENEYKEKERTLYNKPLNELLEIIKEEYYYVSRPYIKKTKCNKCNNDRKLELEDVYGRKYLINCVCDEQIRDKFIVETKYIGTITQISKRDNKLCMWNTFSYKKDSYGDDYISGSYFNKDSIVHDVNELINKLTDEDIKKFKKNYSYSCYTFIDKKQAQKFADYLNEIIKE